MVNKMIITDLFETAIREGDDRIINGEVAFEEVHELDMDFIICYSVDEEIAKFCVDTSTMYITEHFRYILNELWSGKELDDIHTGDVINFIVFASNNCAHFNPKNMVVYDENVICL